MLRVGTVVMGVGDRERAAAFRSRALDDEPNRYPSDADFVVLADPEGKRFCVIDTGGH